MGRIFYKGKGRRLKIAKDPVMEQLLKNGSSITAHQYLAYFLR